MNRKLLSYFCLIGTAFAPHHVLAQAENELPSIEETSPVLNPVEVEAFIDGYMASYLEEADIAGATVAVIERAETIFSKGYGFADVEARAPVDPEQTLFRIGSVSKLFVWTSVMQLVERGELDLDANLNDYLDDLEIPEAFETPVTMTQLMTHTAGFDERVLGLFAADASAVRPLGDILREELPARVRPPGELTSYPNHGTALAMYVVEQITGMSWDDYLEENILEPLELRSTSFAQPLPETLEPRLSKGYEFTGTGLVEAPFEIVPMAPVGAAASSAIDMARFLAAHLRLGAFGDTRILREETARRMQRTLFRHHPDVNGMAYGFMEMDWNGERIIGHGGDTELFHTLFAFFPERDIGLFASFNTVGANYMRFLEAFVDWRFPRDEHPAAVPLSGLGRFAGSYRPTRYPHRTIAKVAGLMATFDVVVEDDHLVTMVPEKREWVPIEPLVFRERGTSATMAFRETDDGRISHLFWSDLPVVAFEPVPRTERPAVVFGVFGAGLFVAIVTVLFWPVAALVRWHYDVSLDKERRIPLFARWSAWLGALALAAFTVGISIAFSDAMDVVYGMSPAAQALFWLPLFAILVVTFAVVGLLQAWRRGRGSLPGRLAYAFVVITLVLFIWQLGVWNLIGFNY